MGDAPTDATRREGAGASPRRDRGGDSERLSRGTLVGRYIILDMLGEGGMGIVYVAFDPELDRKVAIKLLQASAGGSESGGSAWLMREAQAMARLQHPNVIAVHDVGTLPGDRVFVAMELVDGGTLRTWLTQPHTWREVVAVMRAAGAGLAAAHAAGLVHRDFKPDNVLVGSDGRVRVMDFGLARLHTAGEPPARDSSSSIEKRSPLSEKLTVAGTVLGTPAYMAPELYAGHPADERSDQFAFGVALFEALYHARPYHRDELAAARTTPPKPKSPPAGVAVPAPLQRAVLRAISIDPAERFPSMTALLDVLDVDPRATRRRFAMVAAALVLVGAVAGGIVLSRAHDQVCAGLDRKLAGAWDPPAHRAVRDAFAATKHARAADAYAAVEATLDRYAGEWTRTAVDSCTATRVHRDQTEADMTLRSDCLDARLAELRALTQLFEHADDALVERADKAAHGLDAIDACSNLALLRAPNAVPANMRDKVDALKAKLAEAKAAALANKIGAGITTSTAAYELAKAMNYDPAIADSLMIRGVNELEGGNVADANADLVEAASAAIRGRRDDILARAALFAAIVVAQSGKSDVAGTWLSIGAAAATHLPGDRDLEIHRYQAEGTVYARSGDPKRAIAADEKALALGIELYGNGGLLVAQLEQELALAQLANQEYAAARPHVEHALSLLEKVMTPDHPDIASALGSLGLIYAHTGDIAKARATYERAIAIREKALGKNNMTLLPVLNNTADMLYKHGDPQGALVFIERAVAIATPLGKTSGLFLTVSTTHAEVLAAAGRLGEARAKLDEIVVDEEQAHSPMLATTLTSRASVELADAKWPAAATFATRAIALIEPQGKDTPALWVPLATLGRAQAALRKRAEAKAALERALAIATAIHETDADLAPVRAALAAIR